MYPFENVAKATMLEMIEKLLILQDRDKKIARLRSELEHIGPERQSLKTRSSGAQAALDAAKLRVKELESQRKDLELEAQAKRALIEKYANQQLQTRKNEEYRALAHEIDGCKEAIVKLEDREIALMELGEAAQKAVAAATQVAAEAKKLMDDQVAQLGAREEKLQQELAAMEASRQELAGAVDDGARGRYERLMKSKGGNVVVGVQHGVCGGCHMRLPTQIIVSCQGQQELVTCTNCGRILYYTRDMDLAVAD
ncbi:MAG TPA: C4-type zinc ribbon domain-containing protein [Verrucomicrobiae bacterium]|nr:C4-type zinc ribbon domain-containing protein [Verrucomicrobiae bacterium]